MLSEILSCIILYILQITSWSLIKEGGLSDGEQQTRDLCEWWKLWVEWPQTQKSFPNYLHAGSLAGTYCEGIPCCGLSEWSIIFYECDWSSFFVDFSCSYIDSDTCIFLMSWSDNQRVEKFQVPHWMHPSCSIWSLELILRSGHATLNVDGVKDGYMETRLQPCASFYAYLPAVKLLSLYILYFIYEATGCPSPVWHLHIPVLYVPFHNGSLQSCNDNFDVYLLRAVLREITLGSVQCSHSPFCGDCTVLDGVSGIVTLGKELMLVLLREVLEMGVGVVACIYYFNRLPLHRVWCCLCYLGLQAAQMAVLFLFLFV